MNPEIQHDRRFQDLQAQNKVHRGFMLSTATLVATGTYFGVQSILNAKVNIDPSKLRYLQMGLPEWQERVGLKGLQAGQKAKVPLRALYLNAIKGMEEQFFRIPSMLQVFNLSAHKLLDQTPLLFSSTDPQELAAIQKHFKTYSPYYKKILNVDPSEWDLTKRTIRFAEGRLSDVEFVGGQWVDKGVRLKHAQIDIDRMPMMGPKGTLTNASKFIKSYIASLGIKPPSLHMPGPGQKDWKFIITGGDTVFQAKARTGHAILTDAFQSYLKLMDDPFETLTGVLKRFTPNAPDKLFQTLGRGSALLEKYALKNRFGVGGSQFLNDSFQNLFKRHVTRGVPLMIGAMYGFKMLNRGVAESGLVEGTPLEGGISGGLAFGYQQLTKGWSQISDITGLTDIKRWQEEKAPGSGKMTAVMAAPLAGIVSGALLSGLAGVAQHADPTANPLISKYTKYPFKISENAQKLGGYLDNLFNTKAMSNIAAKIAPEEATRIRQWATKGGLLGAALSLPLIFGAIGSKYKPDELEEIYSGEKLLPRRKGRWWECLAYGTCIITKHGYKEIQDIVAGDEVLTHTGEFRTVLKRFNYRLDDKRLISIQLWHTGIPTRLTDNHLMLKYVEGKVKEVHAGELVEGDWLVYPKPVYPDNIRSINFARYLSSKCLIENKEIWRLEENHVSGHFAKIGRPMKSSANCTRDLGYFFGLYLGDGNILSSNGKMTGIEFAFNIGEEDVVEACRNAGEKLFNIQATTRVKTNAGRPSCYIVRFCNTSLSEIFLNLFGVDKNIPEILYNIHGKAFYEGLLSGFMDSDGYDHDSVCTITAKNLDHLVFLRNISLAKLNLYGTLTYHDKGSDTYQITYRHDGQMSAIDKIRDVGDYIAIKIYKIDNVVDYNHQLVYDLQVEQNHTYCTLTFAVHNSGTEAFEGGDIEGYHPHWTVRMRTDARAKSVYGEKYYGSPIKRLLDWSTDAYYLERSHAVAGTRSYDVYGPGDLGLGFVGKLYKHSIGKILKPPVYFAATDEDLERIKQADPYSFRHAANETFAAFTEGVGLRGFVGRSIMEHFTGRQQLFEESAVMQSSDAITSLNRQYWDADIGSAAMNSESVRRLFNRPLKGVEYMQSPGITAGASWLPSRLNVGDPFATIPGGEYRLPGKGFSALHPELEGVNPEFYPDVWKLNILGDVAPYSQEALSMEQKVTSMYNSGALSEPEAKVYGDYMRRKEERDRDLKMLDYKPSDHLLGQYWETLGKVGRANPLESLVPVSPMHKFAPTRDPIEEYRDTQVLDKKYKMWQNPIRDYIKPTFNKAASLVDKDFIPSSTATGNSIEEQFQKMQFVKNDMIRQEMIKTHSEWEKQVLRESLQKTLYDANPYDAADRVIKYLPRKERKFFEAFAGEQDQERRQQIMSMAPGYMQPMYEAQWDRQKMFELQDQAIAGRQLSGSQQDELVALQQKMASRGLESPTGEDMIVGSDAEARRIQLHNIKENSTLPGSSFAGWDKDIPLNAVKAKVLQNENLNVHDFDIWAEDQAIARAIPTGVGSQVDINGSMMGDLRNTTYRQLMRLGVRDISIHAYPAHSGGIKMNLEKDNREAVARKLREEGYI